MTEPSEWAMEKARIVYDALETTRECFVGTPAEHRDIAALARALDEARALNTEQEAMLLNKAKTIKEMQASQEGREALAWMQMHMPYCYCKAVRAMIAASPLAAKKSAE